MTRKTALYYLTVGSLLSLIFLGLAWELWLAPLRPGGSLAALKVIPLLLPLLGILRGKIFTYQWSSMFILLYFMEGIMRWWSEAGLASALAGIEVGLTVIFFWTAIGFVRMSARQKSA